MKKRENKSNVVLIVLDTVRADHLSCYGYKRKTTPNIDKIAEKGVLFKNAFSPGSWTPPSHASIFTGKYPSKHRTLGENVRLEKNNATFAEIMNRNGYATVAVVACPILSSENGFDRGFQTFINVYEQVHALNHKKSSNHQNKLSNKDSWDKLVLKFLKQGPHETLGTMIYGKDKFTYRTNKTILKLLRNLRKQNKPFFLFVNYFECHAPYDPPRPFKKLFLNSIRQPRLYLTELILARLGKRNKDKINNDHVDFQKICSIANGPGAFSFMAGNFDVSEEEWDIVKSLYDGEIAYLDYQIGRLFNMLYEEGVFDDTLLIITSDHGENFGEHGLASHAVSLYDSLLHVPLIMIHPSIIPKKKKLSSIVSTIDIMPTVLDLLKIHTRDNEYEFQGRSLYPFDENENERLIFAEYGYAWRARAHILGRARKRLKMENGLKCVRTSTFKYILSSSGKEELYNIKKDPSEEMNIASKYPEKTKYLKKELEKELDISYFGPTESSYTQQESEEIKKRLEALGYI